MTEQKIAEIKETAKKLGITIGNKKPETLEAEIEALNVSDGTEPEAPEPVDPPVMTSPAPDGGIPEVQEAARTEARLKALEQALVKEQEKNRKLESDAEEMRSTMARIPNQGIPERPNTNVMVYTKNEKGEIVHKQVSPEEAKMLYEEGYVDTPAKL
jgi:hypothetical protein